MSRKVERQQDGKGRLVSPLVEKIGRESLVLADAELSLKDKIERESMLLRERDRVRLLTMPTADLNSWMDREKIRYVSHSTYWDEEKKQSLTTVAYRNSETERVTG